MELKDTYNIRDTEVVWDNLKSPDVQVVKKELLKILEETVDVYSTHPEARSVNENRNCCYYEENKGTFCAVGRVIPKEYLEYILEDPEDPDNMSFNDNVSADGLICKFMPDIPHYTLVISSLNYIQGLHDIDQCWDNNGKLTPMGVEHYEKIKEDLC